ncbi:sulfatase-like hydrolase/transferase [Nitrosopumilus maritimus]|uniref:sulfatase-like hydrolase/transferase n=1 Tax=Nitrosopumilus maritimus TaxID=338192 RepID=UPI00164FB520|nr:sulfatase-like hydrolase/transferase [Nitrosopumilus maritimus]
MFSEPISKFPFHPFLIGFFFVISLFYNNIRVLNFDEILIPLIIVLGIITSIWILINLIVKNNLKSSLILSLVLILFFSYGHIYLEIDHFTINEFDIGKHRFLLIPFFSMFILGTILLIRTKKILDNTTLITNTIFLVLVVIVLVNIQLYYFENPSYFYLNQNIESNTISNNINTFPNIYFIVLDGYPGYRSLELSHQNDGEFFNYFKNNGFFVSENSFSNYQVTHLSVPSTLNLDYLHPLAEIKDGVYDQRDFHLLGNDNKLMNFLKSNGYLIVNFDSSWSFSRDMKHADLQLCGDNQFLNSEFLIMLTKTSMLNPVYTKAFENDLVELRLCAFDQILDIDKRVSEPFFVFSHMYMPHPPYLFGPNGEILSPDELDLIAYSPEKQSAYFDQVKFLNKKIPQIVNNLLDSENPPIIVIQSDHGSAFLMGEDDTNWKHPDNNMLLERMNIINFIYLPDSPDILYDEITPVNTFRIILNHYFGTNFEILNDNSYIFNGTDFEDVTIKLKNIEN